MDQSTETALRYLHSQAVALRDTAVSDPGRSSLVSEVELANKLLHQARSKPELAEFIGEVKLVRWSSQNEFGYCNVQMRAVALVTGQVICAVEAVLPSVSASKASSPPRTNEPTMVIHNSGTMTGVAIANARSSASAGHEPEAVRACVLGIVKEVGRVLAAAHMDGRRREYLQQQLKELQSEVTNAEPDHSILVGCLSALSATVRESVPAAAAMTARTLIEKALEMVGISNR